MLKLSRQQRTAIFALEPPRIEGKGTCPVKPGHWQPLSSKVSIEVRAIRRHKGGGWSLQYTIHDRRDPVRNLRRTPPSLHDDQLRSVPTQEAIEIAAEQSSYTSAPTSLSDAGEATGADWLKKETSRVRKSEQAGRAKRKAKLDAVPLSERVAELERRARLGEDVRRELTAIRRRVDAAERRSAA